MLINWISCHSAVDYCTCTIRFREPWQENLLFNVNNLKKKRTVNTQICMSECRVWVEMLAYAVWGVVLYLAFNLPHLACRDCWGMASAWYVLHDTCMCNMTLVWDSNMWHDTCIYENLCNATLSINTSLNDTTCESGLMHRYVVARAITSSHKQGFYFKKARYLEHHAGELTPCVGQDGQSWPHTLLSLPLKHALHALCVPHSHWGLWHSHL